MKPDEHLTATRVRAPRAAAIAGILFSILLIASFLLLRRSVPADPREAGAWLQTRSNIVALALNLVPFAGIAFLWFIGMLRDRLGEPEDRFFATVFLGSGRGFGPRSRTRSCCRGPRSTPARARIRQASAPSRRRVPAECTRMPGRN